MTAAGECLIDTTQPECATAWCDENRVERDVDYDGPLAPVTGSWTENAPDAQVISSQIDMSKCCLVLFVLPDHLFDINVNVIA